jgi:hypothetical protein
MTGDEGVEPYDLWQDLRKQQIHMTMEQLLALVPNFRDSLIKQLTEPVRASESDMEAVTMGVSSDGSAKPEAEVQPPVFDEAVPVISVTLENSSVGGVLLDGGSRVNILSEQMLAPLGITKWESAPFVVRMADQRRVQPLGLLCGLKMEVCGMNFEIAAVILRMEDISGSYPLLLGRPWLRQARVKQDWQSDRITIRKGKKKLKLSVRTKRGLQTPFRPSMAEGINMMDGMGDEEEDDYLSRNPELVSLFEVDVVAVLEQYQQQNPSTKQKSSGSSKKPVEGSLPEGIGDMPDEEGVAEAERVFEQELQRSRRVKEDELLDLNLGTEDDPKNVRVSAKLDKGFREKLELLLKSFKDVFAWDYTDLLGIDPKFYQHKINLKTDAVPVRQQRYRMNPNYAQRVKEELDRLLKVGFICPVDRATWLSPIVIVPKKNLKLRVCVDYRKLNAATITDPFPLPFNDTMLDTVAGHEMYSFLDGFSGYNQVQMAPEDREKTTFITEWGAFVFLVMAFGLKNAPATFQRMV